MNSEAIHPTPLGCIFFSDAELRIRSYHGVFSNIILWVINIKRWLILKHCEFIFFVCMKSILFNFWSSFIGNVRYRGKKLKLSFSLMSYVDLYEILGNASLLLMISYIVLAYVRWLVHVFDLFTLDHYLFSWMDVQYCIFNLTIYYFLFDILFKW